MAQEVFGEYKAYTTPGGIRYQKGGRLVPKASVPAEIQSYMEFKLETGERGRVETPAESPRPLITPEESARLKAETTAVRPELQMTPEEVARQLAPEDFAEEAPVITEQTPVNVGPFPEQLNIPKEISSFKAEPIAPDFLESISIHTAPIQDIAEALYQRFGLYTVYLGRLPEADTINPLTGELFTNYHLGIAYQAAIRAQNTGVLQIDPRDNRAAIDQNRVASANLEQQFIPQPRTFGEARQANSFDYRTSVRGMNENASGASDSTIQHLDHDEDEMIVEPRFGKQVIKPNW